MENRISKDAIKDVIKEMFKNEEIEIIVNVVPESAEFGDGQWNVTQTILVIDGERIQIGDGNVELVDPI